MGTKSRYREIFCVLEQSRTSVHNPGLTLAETDLSDHIFRELCSSSEHNSHLSARELSNRCSMPYHRARGLLYRIRRYGTQVGPEEFMMFFGTLGVHDRRRLAVFFPHLVPSHFPDVVAPSSSSGPEPGQGPGSGLLRVEGGGDIVESKTKACCCVM